MSKTFKDIIQYEVVNMESGVLRVQFSMGGKEVAVLYYENPKKTWTRKPVLPKVWTCVDAKIHEPVMLFIKDLVTPIELMRWSQELVANHITPS